MDYQNGKIYVVRNHTNEKVYVGSTTQSLAKRMSEHKTKMRTKKYPLYDAMNEIGVDQFYIELVEAFPCNSREELNAREGHFVREYDSFNNGYNKNVAGRTPQQYDDDNREARKEASNKWKRDNAERYQEYLERNKERLNEKIECECGGRYSRKHQSTHFKTTKHQNFVRG